MGGFSTGLDQKGFEFTGGQLEDLLLMILLELLSYT